MRKRIARCPIAFLALALASCSDSSGPEGLRVLTCNSGIAYAIGQTKAGALTTRDCQDPTTDAFGDYYQFTLSASGPVSITVTTDPAADVEVLLYKQGMPSAIEGELVSTRGTALVGGMLEAGTYFLVVQAASSETVGPGEELPYTVTSSAELPPPFDCFSLIPYTTGMTVQGSFTTNDCRDENGYAPADYYRFTIAEVRDVRVTLTHVSGQGPVRAVLYAGDEVALNGAIAPPGAVVSFTARVTPGTYIIMVTSDAPGATYRIGTAVTVPSP